MLLKQSTCNAWYDYGTTKRWSSKELGSCDQDDEAVCAAWGAMAARAWAIGAHAAGDEESAAPPTPKSESTPTEGKECDGASTAVADATSVSLPSSAAAWAQLPPSLCFTSLWSHCVSPALAALRVAATDARATVRDHALLTLRELLLLRYNDAVSRQPR